MGELERIGDGKCFKNNLADSQGRQGPFNKYKLADGLGKARRANVNGGIETTWAGTKIILSLV